MERMISVANEASKKMTSEMEASETASVETSADASLTASVNTTTNKTSKTTANSLGDLDTTALDFNQVAQDGFDEAAWIEVLRAMEESYIQSINYQTEIEQKNEELAQAHQFISDVVSTMSDVLIVVDEALVISDVNQSFLRMSGLKSDEVIGHPIQEVLQNDSKLDNGIFNTPGNHQDIRMSLKGRFGQVPLSVSCSCQVDSPHLFNGKVIVGRPISELLQAFESLKQAHEALARAQEQVVHAEKMAALGRLVSGVAHELNTPISVVYGNMWPLKQYTQQLEQYIQEVSPHLPTAVREQMAQKYHLEDVLDDLPSLVNGTEEATRQVSRIVKDLKGFSSHDGDAQQLFNVSRSIRVAADWVGGNAKAHSNLTMELLLDDEVEVFGVASKFQQVMINLLQNALDALEVSNDIAGHPPKITVRMEVDNVSEAGHVSILVQDNGPGIPTEHLDKLFEPFFTTKSVGEGTGLGLSISYGLIEEMHGKLSVWNQVEQGAVFQIDLPLNQLE